MPYPLAGDEHLTLLHQLPTELIDLDQRDFRHENQKQHRWVSLRGQAAELAQRMYREVEITWPGLAPLQRGPKDGRLPVPHADDVVARLDRQRQLISVSLVVDAGTVHGRTNDGSQYDG